MSASANPTVRHYRFCGPITGAAHEAYVLLGTEDVSFELELDTDYCIIIKVGNDGDMTAGGTWQLQVEIDGAGGFADVNAASSNFRSTDSGDVDAATSATERLGTSAETFSNSELEEVDGAIGTNVGGGTEYAFYFAFNVRSAELSGGESVEFRLTTGGATFTHNIALDATVASADVGAITATVPMAFAKSVADLEAKGKLDAIVALAFGAPSVDLTDATPPAGAISATVPMAFAKSVADLEGKGKLDATVALIIGAPTVDLEGKGKLDASVPLAFAKSAADLEGKGKLDALVQMAFAKSAADLQGKGKLDATVPLVFAKSVADLEGKGKLDATVPMVIGAPSVDLTDATPPEGAISATVPIVIGAPTADLEGGGKLDALVQMILGAPTVDLEGKGKLDATVLMVFGAPVVNLTDASGGAMSATVPMAFSKVLANLVNATPSVGGATKRHLGPFMLQFAT